LIAQGDSKYVAYEMHRGCTKRLVDCAEIEMWGNILTMPVDEEITQKWLISQGDSNMSQNSHHADRQGSCRGLIDCTGRLKYWQDSHHAKTRLCQKIDQLHREIKL